MIRRLFSVLIASAALGALPARAEAPSSGGLVATDGIVSAACVATGSRDADGAPIAVFRLSVSGQVVHEGDRCDPRGRVGVSALLVTSGAEGAGRAPAAFHDRLYSDFYFLERSPQRPPRVVGLRAWRGEPATVFLWPDGVVPHRLTYLDADRVDVAAQVGVGAGGKTIALAGTCAFVFDWMVGELRPSANAPGAATSAGEGACPQ